MPAFLQRLRASVTAKLLFISAYLPQRRDIDAKGFSAEWKVLHLARGYPGEWRDGWIGIA